MCERASKFAKAPGVGDKPSFGLQKSSVKPAVGTGVDFGVSTVVPSFDCGES